MLRTLSAFGVCALALTLATSSSSQTSQTPAAKPIRKASNKPAAETVAFHEDWTTLTLQHSTLRMKFPTLADTGEFTDHHFIRERYVVEWRPNDPFDLYVIRPIGVAQPPVILYLYSFPDDTEMFKSDAWCESAVSGGYAAVGFVSALTGHRTRYRLLKESLLSEMQEALASTTHDTQLIVDYLATRNDLDSGRVGMFGLGSGGAIAVLASAADSRITAVDVLSPWGDWPSWVAETKIVSEEQRSVMIQPEFLSKVAPLDPVAWLPKSKAKSLRVQDIRNNKSMPDSSQEKLEAAAPDFAVINEYGNGRAYIADQPKIATFDWLKEQLRRDAKAQPVAQKSVHFYPAIEAPAQTWPNMGKSDSAKPQAAAKQKVQGEKNNQ